ncbi:MAG: type II glyceraldehyde-3-phosphate dehydrogenase [Cenarchaeum sp. SB0665_bin_23]|nr:type II glyceraldehyde-3-phosphate dehydrogenase [Cenarchaeum sp. SB0667_bin_13]MXY37706.1 type II glyceraldehyde-3-phosphate dehydrogenase [Cenarchaeum sp. SB0664_bin_35]MXY61263.1 type II glyceraldehyde-3-phosphate dehydrogenase [Cenarchaeum sp. SB0665_bin_23]MXZ93684.1 type II glyceraldehyde-3-phosphate dehydrogenase [Cenarchaeum sp. SB0666_bin_15]MYB47561.1 type II glyceraldehyde-3-phosphate dehydrogenase [Cenarchaeum sp. SB0662_bin_33]MYC79023.1 type II glyceraldehyde-3-phosphate dehyd
MVKAFVNGYGSIGSRIASFLQDDPQVDVVGVGKYSPDAGVDRAISLGLDVYVPHERIPKFNGRATGDIKSALDAADIVIDASPGGHGLRNKELYERHDVSVIYQGGESVFGSDAVSNFIFNSRVNYGDALGRRDAVQGSCNVTGLGRIIEPLRERYGDSIKRLDITLIRRWADIEQTSKSLPDTIQFTPNPHHADDARAYLGDDIPIYVRSVKVPTRQMHLHIMDIRFQAEAPPADDIHRLFAAERGVAVLFGATDTKQVRDFADTMKYNFTDTNMVHIHTEMSASRGDMVQMVYSDDQTGIVIPENHMLLQAMMLQKPYEEAVHHTESLFHMEQRKAALESHFSST